MRAIRQHAFGGPEELRLEEVPDPIPRATEVRIRVHSAGVHLIDTILREGQRRGRLPLPALPMVPGREVAGVVEAVGGGVDERLVGRRVVADLGAAGGGYAEYALAPIASVHELQEKVDFDAAVAMVGTGRTALAILEVAAPVRGDVAVVTAAAGGVGTLLVQALARAGVVVVGLAAGPAKLALARRLGAAHAIDYTQQGWPETVRAALHGQDVTIGLDGIGGTIGRETLELIAPGGRLVMFGSASGSLTPLAADDLFGRAITTSAVAAARLAQRPGGLRPLEARALQWAADGDVSPVIGQRFSLAETAAAHEAVESRRTTGKTVLRP